MRFFKFLERGGIGPLTGFPWRAREWVEAQGPLAICGNGAHVLRPQDLAYWMHEELWRAEIEGEQIEGGDCVVARRVRLIERVDAWTNGEGMRFAQACHDRVGERAAQATDPAMKEHLANYHWAVGWHVERKNATMAGYVSALGIAQITSIGTPGECYRRERDWQSDWIVRELRLV